MNSSDQSRFQSASDQARRNMDDARRRLHGAGDQLGSRAGDALRGVRGWSSRHLPGGERTLWVAVGLILLVIFIWTILPGDQAGGPGFRQNGPQPVGVAKAVRGDIDITLNALGTVTPLATVTVRPQVSGQLLRIDFQEGQLVKAGDLLAEIDPRSFQAALDQARGQLARDTAALNNAELDLKRDQALYAQKAVSQQVLDTQTALVKQDQGVVMADKAAAETAAINLGYTRIVSPVAGRVGIRQVDIGNYVTSGQTTGIVVVTQLEPMSVLFSIPEDNVGEVVTRLRAGDTLRADAYDRSQAEKLATGKLSAVDTQIDTTTGTVKLRALFDNTDGALFPNQFVNIRLLVRTDRNQVVVPAAAIQRGAEGIYVYVITPQNTAMMRTITLGPQQDDRVAVLKGLNPGEIVVTDGADRLSDGAEVTIPSGPKADASVVAAQNATAIPATERARAERRAKLMKACAADIKKYCASSQGFAVMKCLRDNVGKLSSECQTSLRSMSGGHGGHGGGLRIHG
ncbi:MAG: MdtA/MuxA family multidrug efflux RND transporter periplasmic adaptor subunit [Alphaproteobacteria bacterium]|nr:MdtA/MuxA family multidrug efflux RND transporter periplasmic adaptor subunit [Alphaproteobacteria bacterium]